MKRRIVVMIAGAAVLGYLQVSPAAQGDVRAAIEAANKQFAGALAKGDAAGIAALYTAGGQALPANSEPVSGRAAIQSFWKGVYDSGITQATLTTSDVESQGDLAAETGTYELRMKDGKVADRGKYVVVWKREDGRWKLHRDIWTTSQPAKP